MKKLFFALVAGVAVFSAAYAAAATLGLTSDGLGAGDSEVLTCADPVLVEYTTRYNSTTTQYDLDEVVLTGDMSGCEDWEYKVTVIDDTGNQISEEHDVVAGATATEWRVTFTDDVPAQDIDHVAVVFTGPGTTAP